MEYGSAPPGTYAQASLDVAIYKAEISRLQSRIEELEEALSLRDEMLADRAAHSKEISPVVDRENYEFIISAKDTEIARLQALIIGLPLPAPPSSGLASHSAEVEQAREEIRKRDEEIERLNDYITTLRIDSISPAMGTAPLAASLNEYSSLLRKKDDEIQRLQELVYASEPLPPPPVYAPAPSTPRDNSVPSSMAFLGEIQRLKGQLDDSALEIERLRDIEAEHSGCEDVIRRLEAELEALRNGMIAPMAFRAAPADPKLVNRIPTPLFTPDDTWMPAPEEAKLSPTPMIERPREIPLVYRCQTPPEKSEDTWEAAPGDGLTMGTKSVDRPREVMIVHRCPTPPAVPEDTWMPEPSSSQLRVANVTDRPREVSLVYRCETPVEMSEDTWMPSPSGSVISSTKSIDRPRDIPLVYRCETPPDEPDTPWMSGPTTAHQPAACMSLEPAVDYTELLREKDDEIARLQELVKNSPRAQEGSLINPLPYLSEIQRMQNSLDDRDQELERLRNIEAEHAECDERIHQLEAELEALRNGMIAPMAFRAAPADPKLVNRIPTPLFTPDDTWMPAPEEAKLSPTPMIERPREIPLVYRCQTPPEKSEDTWEAAPGDGLTMGTKSVDRPREVMIVHRCPTPPAVPEDTWMPEPSSSQLRVANVTDRPREVSLVYRCETPVEMSEDTWMPSPSGSVISSTKSIDRPRDIPLVYRCETPPDEPDTPWMSGPTTAHQPAACMSLEPAVDYTELLREKDDEIARLQELVKNSPRAQEGSLINPLPYLSEIQRMQNSLDDRDQELERLRNIEAEHAECDERIHQLEAELEALRNGMIAPMAFRAAPADPKLVNRIPTPLFTPDDTWMPAPEEAKLSPTPMIERPREIPLVYRCQTPPEKSEDTWEAAPGDGLTMGTKSVDRPREVMIVHRCPTPPAVPEDTWMPEPGSGDQVLGVASVSALPKEIPLVTRLPTPEPDGFSYIPSTAPDPGLCLSYTPQTVSIDEADALRQRIADLEDEVARLTAQASTNSSLGLPTAYSSGSIPLVTRLPTPEPMPYDTWQAEPGSEVIRAAPANIAVPRSVELVTRLSTPPIGPYDTWPLAYDTASPASYASALPLPVLREAPIIPAASISIDYESLLVQRASEIARLHGLLASNALRLEEACKQVAERDAQIVNLRNQLSTFSSQSTLELLGSPDPEIQRQLAELKERLHDRDTLIRDSIYHRDEAIQREREAAELQQEVNALRAQLADRELAKTLSRGPRDGPDYDKLIKEKDDENERLRVLLHQRMITERSKYSTPTVVAPTFPLPQSSAPATPAQMELVRKLDEKSRLASHLMGTIREQNDSYRALQEAHSAQSRRCSALEETLRRQESTISSLVRTPTFSARGSVADSDIPGGTPTTGAAEILALRSIIAEKDREISTLRTRLNENTQTLASLSGLV
ncbi:hypothetical protein GMRT_11039 [Giardia muris]|uniref:Coiled-coil protein n=1 Tax=Giardia muris TaxID=5742 RepID=A0A4Z1SZV0_GIAMU|nr:hypothetical protein GMRT_11039 [Giardia muris]|eukprot:TNJ27173.1 hypothetical protein GMRT_11039 [Giardia muris]